MTDRQLLEKILEEQQAIRQEQVETNKRITAVEEHLTLKIEVVNKRVGDVERGLSKLERNLRTEIRSAQEDTIDALKALLLPPLDSHEVRITTLEEEAGIKPRKH